MIFRSEEEAAFWRSVYIDWIPLAGSQADQRADDALNEYLARRSALDQNADK